MAPSPDAPDGGARLRAPYLGLTAFGDSDTDAELFFGRSAERDVVIANLQSARVTVLYGPSGVGKSSLLHAGVVHSLRAMEEPSPVILIDDWDADPARALTAGVRAAAGVERTQGAVSVIDAIDELRARPVGALLVILDRFEDYLRLHPRRTGDEFENTLRALVSPPDLVARVLIALRDDRLADLDLLEDRIPGLFGNVLRLEPLSREAAREAIVGPVERYNVHLHGVGTGGEITLEEGLPERVLDELGELGSRRNGAVGESVSDGYSDARIDPAFLSLTMRRVWDADVGTGGTELRLATLASLGGAGRIFATHLEATMAGLPASEQQLAADLLRFMVTPSGATQRYSVADLSTYVGRRPAEVEALAEKLSGARILRATATPGRDGPTAQYELAHQVLARPALEWQSRYRTARLERRSRRLLLALVAVSAIALALVGYVLQPGALGRLDLSTVDARFAIRGAQGPDRDIALVGIDNSTYLRLWPSSTDRTAIARALDRIASVHPRAIAVDIIFTGRQTPASDAALIAAVHRNGSRLVLATDSVNGAGKTMLFGREGQTFSDTGKPAAAFPGFPENSSDPGVVRMQERNISIQTGQGQGAPMDTLPVVTARVASPGAPVAAPATTWIDFRGGAGTFPIVPFDDVLAGRPSALSRLRDRVVVLGVTGSIVHDIHDTSAPGQSVMSGPEIQANAISTALRGYPLRSVGHGFDVVLIVGLGLVPFALGLLLGPALYAAGVLAVGVLFCVGAQLAFDSGHVIDVVFPLTSLLISGIGVLVVLLLRQTRPEPSAGDRGGRLNMDSAARLGAGPA